MGKAYFVGDPHQAIYGFTGADSDSLNKIKEEFGAKSMPLTVTYRCPKAVVREAQKYVSHIQAHESAPEGVVRNIDYKQIKLEKLDATKACVCRKTAPLVELAYSLIAAKIPCHVEGREIGNGLLALANKWKKVRTVGALKERLEKYLEEQTAKLIAKGREMAIDALSDKVETLFVIMESLSEDADIRDLQDAIKSIFQDNAPNFTLSTIHKSKGREWNTVYWLGSEKYQPSKFARQAWQQEQENNLFYVAATRAKQELVYVTAKPEEK